MEILSKGMSVDCTVEEISDWIIPPKPESFAKRRSLLRTGLIHPVTVVFYEKASVRTPNVDAALAGLLVVSSGSSESMSRLTFDSSKFCVIWMEFALVSISLDFPLLSG